MATDFETFLRSLVGGPGLSGAAGLPGAAQQVPTTPLIGPTPTAPVQQQQVPIVGPTPVTPVTPNVATPVQQSSVLTGPTQVPTGPTVVPQQQQPAQTSSSPGRPLSPQEFAMWVGQDPYGQPSVQEQTQADYGGTWQSVSYQYNGVTYNILMPIENTANLPEGAVLVGDPIVDDPERVARAQEAGQNGQQGQSQIGLLSQMPPEIRNVFRSSQDVWEVSQNREVPSAEDQTLGVNGEPIDTWGTNAPAEPTTLPPLVEGQTHDETVNQLGQGQAEFDQMMQDVSSVGTDYAMARQMPKLTTEALRQTDPVKANALEEAGIFEVAGTQMVVQDNQDGSLHIRPASETAPEGFTIYTYGGLGAPPDSSPGSDGLGWFDQVMEVLEKPQRWLQEGFSNAWDSSSGVINFYVDNVTRPFWGAIADAIGVDMETFKRYTLGGSQRVTFGLFAFAVWMETHPNEVTAAREGGYNGFSGERAVWERFQADRNWLERTADSLLTDPLNFIPSLGAPVRKASEMLEMAARGFGRADEAVDVAENVARTTRRGSGVVDEAVDEAIQTRPRPGTDAEVAQDFANAPTVVEEPPVVRNPTNTIDNAGTQVSEASELVPTGAATVPQNVNRPLQVTSDVLNQVANVLDIPENVLGWFIDNLAIRPGGFALRGLGNIPLGEGRQVSDIFAGTNLSDLRNETEQVQTTIQDVMGRNANEGAIPGSEAVPTEVVPEGGASAQAAVPTQATLDLDATTPNQAATGAAANEIAPSPVAQADAVVETPSAASSVEPIVESAPAPLRQDAEFRQSKIGQWTEKQVAKWPDWLRPQTAADRAAGTGRVGSEFRNRPQDTARALAAEYPEKWAAYLREYNHRLNLKTGYIAKEAGRKANQWAHLVSDRQGLRVDGRDLRSAYEVMLEASHYIREAVPIFNKHFAEDAEAPEWAWKRWVRGSETTTALDTLSRNGGRYQKGTYLPEAVEIAIFHPDPQIRESAYLDLVDRLALRDDRGKITWSSNQNPVIHPRVPREIKNLFQSQRDDSIQGLHRGYEELVSANEALGQQFPDRLNADDAISLSDQINPAPVVDQQPVDPGTIRLPRTGEQGQDVYEADFNRSLIEDRAPQINPEATGEPGSAVYDRAIDPEGAALYDQAIEQNRRNLPIFGQSGGISVPKPRVKPPTTSQEVADNIRSIQEWRASTPKADISTTRQQYLDTTTRGRAAKVRETAPAISQEARDSLYVRGRPVGDTEARTLSQQFSDGETLAERWDRLTVEYMDSGMEVEAAEAAAAARTINDYAVEIMPDDLRKRYATELKKASSENVDLDGTGEPRKRTAVEAQIRAMERIYANHGAGRAGRFWRRYDQIMSGLRKTFLYNWLTGPRYVTTQLAGNWVTAGVTKHHQTMAEILSGDTISRAWKAAHAEGELPVSTMDEALAGYGLHGNRNITRGTAQVRDQTLEDAANATAKKGNSLLGKYVPFIADKRLQLMAGSIDRISRESLYASFLDQNMLVPRNTLRQRMIASAPVGQAERVAEIFDSLPQRFGSDDLRDAFEEIGGKWSERHARDWQEALTKTDKAARDEVRRVFFDGTETNIDVVLKRMVFFHYWMSRAVPLYTEAIARDPVFLWNFARLVDETRNDDDLSGSAFFRIMQTPMGYNLLIRPDAMLATFTSLMDANEFSPEGETLVGSALRNSPIMVNPLIQMGLNLVGASGDTFTPDPVGANKFIQFGQAVIDNANAQFGWGLPPVGNFQDEAFRHVRSFLSGALDPVTPDWLLNEVPYVDGMAYKNNEVRAIIAEIALSRGMTLDDPIVQQAMVDPSSELYQEAMKKYSRQDALDIALRIIPVTSVLYPRSQLASPKERTLAIASERETAQQTGIGITPTAQQLYTDRDTINAVDQNSRDMQAWEDEYKSIGGPEARGAFSFWNSIRYAGTEDPIAIGGRMWYPQDIQGLDESGREELANQWAEETGTTEMIESVRAEREAFRESHPEYAAFTSWSAQLNDYEGGPQQWAIDAAAGNPNYARWYNSLSDEDQQSDVVLTSLDAYFAFQGDQMNYYEPNPIDTRTAVDPTPYNPINGDGSSSTTTSGGGSRQTGPTEETIVQQIDQYEQDMAAYNAAASQMLGGQQVNVDWLNPMARSAVVSNLESVGIARPRMGGYLYDYMQWAQAQGGGDTSIAAYLRWWQQQNPQEEQVTPAE